MFDLWTESYANINCDMDFSLYPFDTQKCDYVIQSITKNKSYQGPLTVNTPLHHTLTGTSFQVFDTIIDRSGAIDHTEKFDLSFVELGEKELSESYPITGFRVELARSPAPFYTNTYLPTGLLTIASFIGFVIPVEIVPGRMALLVTTFLMLVNIKSTERTVGPVVSFLHETDVPISDKNCPFISSSSGKKKKRAVVLQLMSVCVCL